MPMQMKCPNPACPMMLTVREEFAGKMIKCPTCGATLMVPTAVPAGVPAAVPAIPVAAPVPPTAAAAGTPLPPEAGGVPKPNPTEVFWSLIDKNQLDRKSQLFLFAGVGAMLFLLFSMLLPRYTLDILLDAKTAESRTAWWILTPAGALIIFATLMVLAFLAAAFVKMHMFLRYGFIAAAVWGAFVFMILFLILVIDAFSGGEAGRIIKTQVSIGIGTYFGILAALGIAGSFGLLSYPEVAKLINRRISNQQAKPGAPSA